MSKTAVYHVWLGMKSRCENPNATKYHRYGAKGITICERWQTFDNFFSDMGLPLANQTIDRIDNAKGYELENCRWASMKVQQNNRTNNRRIAYRDQTRTLQQWADLTNIGRATLARRLELGWPIERALTVKPFLGRNQYSK